MLFGYVKYIFYSVNGSALYYTKLVQIWYKKEAWSAKPLSLRFRETTKSSTPVAGSKREAVMLLFFVAILYYKRVCIYVGLGKGRLNYGYTSN